MTVIKQFGKLASPALSFGNTIDDQVHNTNRGDSSGEGWNMPGSDNPIWDGKFPVNHPYFWNEDPAIKINDDWAFSCAIRSNLIYPRINGALTDITSRAQYETIRNQTRIGFCFSLYIPTDKLKPEYVRRNIFQRFGGGSPGFSMYADFRSDGRDWLSIRIYRDGNNLIYMPITEIQYNTWYHVIGFCDFRNDLDGRLTIWLDRKVARVYPRIGSSEATAVYSRVPVVTGTTNYTRADNLGDFVGGTVTEDGFTQHLLDWKGLTVKPDNNPATGQWNWGPYPGRFSFYSPFPEIESKALQFPDAPITEWGQVPLKNFDDPLEPNFLHPDFRVLEYNSNFTLAVWGEGQTDEDVFRELHPEGLAPLEFPVGESAWPNGFTSNTISGFTLTLTTTSGGEATRDPATGDIEQNATVILTATPATGFNFSRWENVLTGQTLSGSETYNHVMTADISIVAVFVSDTPVEPGDAIRFCRIDEPIV